MVDFVKGDTVRLKSRGPVMTVTTVGESLGTPTIWTVWFDGTKKHEADFPPEALNKAEPKTVGTVGVRRL